MTNILELGKRGAESVGELYTPEASPLPADLAQRLEIIKRFPSMRIEADTADGTKRAVSVHPLLLKTPQVFALVHGLAPYEPMVYARQGNRAVLGMLSPNYSGHGEADEQRLPSIKVIPLQAPYPLTSKLTPDTRMTTMLAGAVSAERKGVGGHSGRVAEDLEHKAAILGAISTNDPSIAIQHKNHSVRQQSSLATGLTNGELGSVYAPDHSISEFTGFGQPMVFQQGTTSDTEIIYIPDSFLDADEARGTYYQGAGRLMVGAAMQTLILRQGAGAVAENIQRLSQRM